MISTDDELNKLTTAMSNFRGLLISQRFLCVILAIIQIFLIIKGLRFYSPLYILFVNAMFPMIMAGIVKNRKKESADESSLPLPLLRKRFRFSYPVLSAYSINFLLMVIFLITWFYSTVGTEYTILHALPMPVLIAFVSVRLLIWLFYRIAFKYFPEKIIK